MSETRGTVEVGGARTSYREAGAGVVAILAAGLGLSSRFYEKSYAAFAAAGVRLIVPDLPGSGETPGPRTGLSPDRTALFLVEFADALNVGRAVWIGHSLGAHTVLALAARWPDRAAGIVLVGPTGEDGRFEMPRQAWALAVEARRASGDVIRAVAREYIRRSPIRYFGTWIRHRREDASELLPRVRCPALILVGDRDPVSRPRHVEALQRGLPAARVVRVPGGTHALPRGHPTEFNRAALEFIGSLASGASE